MPPECEETHSIFCRAFDDRFFEVAVGCGCFALLAALTFVLAGCVSLDLLRETFAEGSITSTGSMRGIASVKASPTASRPILCFSLRFIRRRVDLEYGETGLADAASSGRIDSARVCDVGGKLLTLHERFPPIPLLVYLLRLMLYRWVLSWLVCEYRCLSRTTLAHSACCKLVLLCHLLLP